MNPYYKEYLNIPYSNHWKDRSELVHKYSWAIPDDNALKEISKYSPLIEIGAGTGYWASLLSEIGTKIICFDKFHDNNHYKHSVGFYYPVYNGGENTLLKFSPKMNLFLSWPPYNEPMASNCLNNFRGKYVIYIGEGIYGCTGDDEFHEELNEKWGLIEEIDIPQWEGIHDYVHIYKRKEK